MIFIMVVKSPPSKFDSKVSIIEEAKDLSSLTMDVLHGTLTAYEMKIMSKIIFKKGSDIQRINEE